MREISPVVTAAHPTRLNLKVSTTKLREVEHQMWHHREESACVRAPSLVGRSETMSPRTPSGRRLMRS
jgi:hypothetical protein